MSREQDFISEARQAAINFWNAYHTFQRLQVEWNAKAYGDTLPDGEGANAGYTKAEVGAVVFDTTEEVELRIFNTGHATNLAKLL